MSRVYFHSPSGEAELRGSERGWLAHVSAGPAIAAWDLNTDPLPRAVEIVSLMPEPAPGATGANYLHDYMRRAVAQDKANLEEIERDWRTAHTDYELVNRFVDALKTALRVRGFDLLVPVDGTTVKVSTSNLEANTALVAGSDVIRLAAKIHHWCEAHCYVEGPDRDWFAGIIDDGLRCGIYRSGDQGWEGVVEFLRGRDDEPVVLSYSVCAGFPNAETAGYLGEWPQGVERNWDALTGEQQAERERLHEQWYELPREEQWRLAIDRLRLDKPWARLAPDTLASVTFSTPVTVYDLFAADRDDRIRRATGRSTTAANAGEE